MSADARSRAAEVLGVPIEATAGAATSAFLAGLSATDFVPPGQSVAALNTLAGLGVPSDADDTSLTLREEVEEFARRYWSLTPADRLAAWLTLTTRSPDDSTADRLLTLQDGLNLPGTPVSDPAAEQIVAIVRELYVLPPRERAIRRNEWLLAYAAQHKELIAVATTIRKNQTAFAALDSVLFARLTPQFDATVFVDAATTSPLPRPPHGPSEPIVSPLPTPRYATPTPPTPRHSEDSNGKVMGWIVGVGTILAIRLMLGTRSQSGSSTTPHYSPDNRYTVPDSYKTSQDPYKTSLPDSYKIMFQFTREQVQECLEYEKNGKKGPVPLHYTGWLLANKPKASDTTNEKLPKVSGSIKPQQSSRFSPENIRRFREYLGNPTSTIPPGFREWVEAGCPNASE